MNKPYRIYRNLHKQKFSIQSYVKEKKGYRVIDRLSTAVLEDCNFKIYENGRQRVLKEKQKNVHAYVEAKSYERIQGEIDTTNLREIYYNPYKFNGFVYKDTSEKIDFVHRILAYNNKLYDVSNVLI